MSICMSPPLYQLKFVKCNIQKLKIEANNYCYVEKTNTMHQASYQFLIFSFLCMLFAAHVFLVVAACHHSCMLIMFQFLQSELTFISGFHNSYENISNFD